MRPHATWFRGAGVALIVLIGIATAAEAQTPASKLQATVAARITPTRQSDRPGGSAVSSEFLPGESKRLNFTAGHRDDLCETRMWAIEPGVAESPAFQTRVREQEASARYIWHIEVTMREVATDRIVFDLVWERISRLAPNDSVRGTQRIAVREGQWVPIDLLHGERNSDCVNVVVDVIAYVHEDTAYLGKTVEWDLWFSGAQSGPVHRALTSPAGESAAFQFEPVTVTVAGADGKVANRTVDVYGEIRGRIRPDGNIDVALTAHRGINSTNFRMRMRPELFRPRNNFGQKNFTLKPGEAIKIILPPLTNSAAPPVQLQTDPMTGERKMTAVPRPAQPAAIPSTNELSITVQARVR